MCGKQNMAQPDTYFSKKQKQDTVLFEQNMTLFICRHRWNLVILNCQCCLVGLLLFNKRSIAQAQKVFMLCDDFSLLKDKKKNKKRRAPVVPLPDVRCLPGSLFSQHGQKVGSRWIRLEMYACQGRNKKKHRSCRKSSNKKKTKKLVWSVWKHF